MNRVSTLVLVLIFVLLAPVANAAEMSVLETIANDPDKLGIKNADFWKK